MIILPSPSSVVFRQPQIPLSAAEGFVCDDNLGCQQAGTGLTSGRKDIALLHLKVVPALLASTNSSSSTINQLTYDSQIETTCEINIEDYSPN